MQTSFVVHDFTVSKILASWAQTEDTVIVIFWRATFSKSAELRFQERAERGEG